MATTDLTRIWQGLGLKDRRGLYVALSAPILGLAAVSLVKAALRATATDIPIYASPRKSLQLLSGAQHPDHLPYPPDALPGGRDIDTPYGNIRAYEWGPEDGRKVLFVHGISTPCIAFAGIAKQLVERGCRVLLFDLFGRGYSDAPDPRVHRQDIGLWTSQIMLVLTSSKLAWTGSDRFTLVGYSMGGGIAAAFTSYFPELVESLVLIASAGLIRPHHITTTNKLLYGGMVPQFVVNGVINRRFHSTTPGAHPAVGGKPKPIGIAKAAAAEQPGHPALARDSDALLFPDRPQMSVAKTVRWEADNHPGFLPSFISSIKYAPTKGSHDRWRLVGNRCTARKASADPDKTPGLNENKVLLILGIQDPVILADETEEDATELLGKDNINVARIAGGHDVPVVNASGCVRAIAEFWDSSPV